MSNDHSPFGVVSAMRDLPPIGAPEKIYIIEQSKEVYRWDEFHRCYVEVRSVPDELITAEEAAGLALTWGISLKEVPELLKKLNSPEFAPEYLILKNKIKALFPPIIVIEGEKG